MTAYDLLPEAILDLVIEGRHAEAEALAALVDDADAVDELLAEVWEDDPPLDEFDGTKREVDESLSTRRPASGGTVKKAAVQPFAEKKPRWQSYTNPVTKQRGWISSGGRVQYTPPPAREILGKAASPAARTSAKRPGRTGRTSPPTHAAVPASQADLAARKKPGGSERTASARDAQRGAGHGLKRMQGAQSRGVRNTLPLTASQQVQIHDAARAIGINPDDVIFFSGARGSIYSDMMDKIVAGTDILPAEGKPVPGTKSVFDRLGVRASLGHEYGHLLAARSGIAFPPGVMEEFQASVLGARHTPGLLPFERFQLLRNALEEAKFNKVEWKELRAQLRHLPGGGSDESVNREKRETR